MAGLHVAKKELRQKIKKVLASLDVEDLKLQTEKATNTLFDLPQYKRARSISVYLSMPAGEIGTTEIVRHALQAGKQVFVPYFYKTKIVEEGRPTSIMDMLELATMKDFEQLKPDKWGIPTLSEESVPSRKNSFGGVGKSEDIGGANNNQHENVDIVILPGMAFDSTLGRLGHGKGFYDYFLQRTSQSYTSRKLQMPFLVGLALNQQLLPGGETVPQDTTDWRLDMLIDGDGRCHQSPADAP